jgi:thiamine pyrophosphokinase
MKRAFVFANGRLEILPPILKEIRSSDIILAADGGTHHCEALGITPNVIIGDFDSLSPQALEKYEKSGTMLIRHPPKKDETDLELVLNYTSDQGIGDVYVIGALGARWDMTFANVLLAAHRRFYHSAIRFVDGHQELTILYGPGKIELSGKTGNSFSLIPLDGNASGITTQGLEYPLSGETLIFGSPRGVSNVIIDDVAWVSLDKGILLVCISSQAAG